MKMSYRLGHASIETLANAQALLLISLSAVNEGSDVRLGEVHARDLVLRIAPDRTVREAVVLSRYDVTHDGNDIIVRCGDLGEDDERYVLVRFRCEAGLGAQPLAELTLEFQPVHQLARQTLATYVAIDRSAGAQVPELDEVVARNLAIVRATTPTPYAPARREPRHEEYDPLRKFVTADRAYTPRYGRIPSRYN
jgi:hypothetical protein